MVQPRCRSWCAGRAAGTAGRRERWVLRAAAGRQDGDRHGPRRPRSFPSSAATSSN